MIFNYFPKISQNYTNRIEQYIFNKTIDKNNVKSKIVKWSDRGRTINIKVNKKDIEHFLKKR